MSIDLVDLETILLLIRLSVVLLSICTGVCGCVWPSSLSILRMWTSILEFKNNSLSSASAADDITLRMIIDRLRKALMFVVFLLHLIGNGGLLSDCVHLFWTGIMHWNGLPVPYHWNWTRWFPPLGMWHTQGIVWTVSLYFRWGDSVQRRWRLRLVALCCILLFSRKGMCMLLEWKTNLPPFESGGGLSMELAYFIFAPYYGGHADRVDDVFLEAVHGRIFWGPRVRTLA